MYGNIEVAEEINRYYDIVEGGVADGNIKFVLRAYYKGKIDKTEVYFQLAKFYNYHQLVISNQKLIDEGVLEFKKRIKIPRKKRKE